MSGKTIAIDFDGTICTWAWPGIGPAVPGAIQTIRRLRVAGHTLILWTCREGQGLMDARLWLNDQGIGDCFATFNEHTESNLATFDNNCRKIAADIYIDDRALGVPKTPDGMVDWPAIDRAILPPEVVDGCPHCEIGRRPPILIGLCGKAGSGKSTATDMLCAIAALSGLKAKRMSFAAPIREMAKEYFGWDGQKDDRGRRLLQRIGTEVGREYNENVWVDYLLRKANELDGALVVVDDVRFDNEAKAIKENGGINVVLRGREIDLGSNSKHASEAGVNADLVMLAVDNSGDRTHLEEQLEYIFRSMSK